MAIRYKTCPKCGHTRSDNDPANSDRCANCGIIYEKWLKQRFKSANHTTEHRESESRHRGRELFDYLLYVNPATDSMVFYGRVLIYLIFFIWGWSFILMDIHWDSFNSSFMHVINLVFHEAGHVLFRPFGEFMTTLGGSLMQLIVPLVAMLALLIKNRDTFGATIGLWWLGQSMMDLAPYINDARSLTMPLLGGGTGADRPGWHDWENILLDLGLIEQDHTIAVMVDGIGSALMIFAFIWGGLILTKLWKTRTNH
ncbi:hypothetical protein BOW53_10390 [Solemya pervernicosa gill symbiont]|uniref:Zinc ribbon domain-containing protein n=1 Tax=Solemya pervernicosa gill symbiont TaxID=642797 RepID=A0A1T2L3N3_9GAMM|nr:zinc ribbon domain-containing protein [Solemya pervernicosa gill symbiont]OOZ39718.1 hypothetical protein BOW53_10390 [Solemya pervernicosa gill symbiont]